MKLIVRGAMTLVVVLCALLGCTGQDKVRQVEQLERYTYPDTPVTVVVNFDDRAMSGRETIAGPDWLHRLNLEVTNTTGKDIKSLRMDLILKEGTPTIPGVVITLELFNSEPRTTLLAAGAHVTLKMVPRVVEISLKQLKDQGVGDVQKAILHIQQVGFTDGTGWYVGMPTWTDPGTGRTEIVPKTTVMQQQLGAVLSDAHSVNSGRPFNFRTTAS